MIPETHMMAGAKDDRERCSGCGRPLGYLMSEDRNRPGLLGSLRGEGGEPWRIFITVALCVLAVLIVTGLAAAAGRIG